MAWNELKGLGVGAGWLGLACIALITVALYWPALHGQAISDDFFLLEVGDQRSVSERVASHFAAGLGGNTDNADNTVPVYRPLFLTALTLIGALGGGDVLAHHLFSVLLYLSNLILLFLILKRHVRVGSAAALGATAFFAFMPSHVESVAWMSGVSDPLAALFLLAAFLSYCVYLESSRPLALAVFLVLYAASLLSKEVALVFPVWALLYGYLAYRRVPALALLLQCLLAGLFMLLRAQALDAGAPLPSPTFERVAGGLDFLSAYAALWFFPLQFPFFTAPPEGALGSVLGWIGLLLGTGLAFLAWRLAAGRQRAIAIAWVAWIALMAWPAMILAAVPTPAFAVRFLYLPSVGLAALLAILCDHLLTHGIPGRALVVGLFGAVLAWNAAVTCQESSSWASPEHLYSKLVEIPPNRTESLIALGNLALERGDLRIASRHFEEAASHARQPLQKAAGLAGLGTVAGLSGEFARSRRLFEEAVAINASNAEAWSGLGNMAWMQGRLGDALHAYETAYRLQPSSAVNVQNLLMAYERSGRTDDARRLRRRAGQD